MICREEVGKQGLQPAQACRVGQVNDWLDRLQGTLVSVQKCAEDLCTRLGPVLCPKPMGTDNAKADVPTLCGIAEQIRNAEQKALHIRNLIQETIDALEV